MSDKNVTTVTDRGQTSIPAALRRELAIGKGKSLLWQKISERELRVTVVSERKPIGARAMRGFASRFRETRPTADWMDRLREGEREGERE